MEASELELFRRSIQQATSSRDGAELDAALDELGWLDAVAVDRGTAVSVLFERQGEANNTSAALDQLLAITMNVKVPLDQIAVILPFVGQMAAPGGNSETRITVRGIGTGALGRRDLAVVCLADGASHRAVSIDMANLSRCRIGGLDPAFGLHEVCGEFDASDATDLGPVDWTDVVAIGQLAIGHELVGTSRTMLELARSHALTREQFGRPIASFQAIRHRLAEGLVAVEAAAALLTAAWEEPTPGVAAMAKGMAGRSTRTVARHAQQVLAGIGFTTEHPLHLSVRRSLVLDQLFGTSASLTRSLGTSVVKNQILPAAFPL
ncbi:MAG TPA: acyl-CoA dehydrogenase family protein [Acidimicrobiales bacterium]|jgi:hypothetical protein